MRRIGQPTDTDYATLRTIVSFIEDRLPERSTIDWAIRRDTNEAAKREAVLRVLEGRAGTNLHEPGRTAWTLVQESWASEGWDDESASDGAYEIKERFARGGYTSAVIAEIVDFVRPRLKIKPLSAGFGESEENERPGKPKSIHDLIWPSITSGELISPVEIGLSKIDKVDFLVTLAQALDNSIAQGIDTARRIGWSEEIGFWRLGGLQRVYFVAERDRPAGECEPDEFAHGIAPAVKLFYAVIQRVSELDLPRALLFVRQLALSSSH